LGGLAKLLFVLLIYFKVNIFLKKSNGDVNFLKKLSQIKVENKGKISTLNTQL
jgi:hypothetical protein